MIAAEGRHLTLIVPGLFGPPPAEATDAEAAVATLVSGLDLSALETLLSRARAQRTAGESPEDLLFTAFGIDRPSGGDWPAAAVARLADVGGDEDPWCLRADPVHLKADRDDLVLFDGEHFALDLDEAQALAGEVAAHFADRGWRIEVPHPLRWYLRLEAPARVRTTPLSMVRLREVDVRLPEGDAASHWHGLLNEVQMVLHGAGTNRAREARGEPVVNSLWFWGGGRRPRAPGAVFDDVWGEPVLLRGLAVLSGARHLPLPADAGAWLKQAGSGRHLAYIDSGHLASRASDLEAWRAFISGFNDNWAAPLVSALARSGGVDGVSLVSDRGMRYDAPRFRWWQRFRGRRAFSTIAPAKGGQAKSTGKA